MRFELTSFERIEHRGDGRLLGQIDLDLRRFELAHRPSTDAAHDHAIDILTGEQPERGAHTVAMMRVVVVHDATAIAFGIDNHECRGGAKVCTHTTLESLVHLNWNTDIHRIPLRLRQRGRRPVDAFHGSNPLAALWAYAHNDASIFLAVAQVCSFGGQRPYSRSALRPS
jgi:hypothetical protein